VPRVCLPLELVSFNVHWTNNSEESGFVAIADARTNALNV
jgi:hypothetical protein